MRPTTILLPTVRPARDPGRGIDVRKLFDGTVSTYSFEKPESDDRR